MASLLTKFFVWSCVCWINDMVCWTHQQIDCGISIDVISQQTVNRQSHGCLGLIPSCKVGSEWSFNYKMVKIVLTSHFHKKVRATIGLVPTSQLPWWWAIKKLSEKFENIMAQLKHQICQDFLQSDCETRPKIPRNFLIERPPWFDRERIT